MPPAVGSLVRDQLGAELLFQKTRDRARIGVVAAAGTAMVEEADLLAA